MGPWPQAHLTKRSHRRQALLPHNVRRRDVSVLSTMDHRLSCLKRTLPCLRPCYLSVTGRTPCQCTPQPSPYVSGCRLLGIKSRFWEPDHIHGDGSPFPEGNKLHCDPQPSSLRRSWHMGFTVCWSMRKARYMTDSYADNTTAHPSSPARYNMCHDHAEELCSY